MEVVEIVKALQDPNVLNKNDLRLKALDLLKHEGELYFMMSKAPIDYDVISRASDDLLGTADEGFDFNATDPVDCFRALICIEMQARELGTQDNNIH